MPHYINIFNVTRSCQIHSIWLWVTATVLPFSFFAFFPSFFLSLFFLHRIQFSTITFYNCTAFYLGPFLFTGSLVLSTQQLDRLFMLSLNDRVVQLRPALCDPVDCSPPGSSVHGLILVKILEWVSMPSSYTEYRTQNTIRLVQVNLTIFPSPGGAVAFCIASPKHIDLWIWQTSPQPHTAAATAKSLQPCLTLCDPTDGSSPGYTIRGILQARTLEWVAISFSTSTT